jgi:predicted PurR-regulated permease PerM
MQDLFAVNGYSGTPKDFQRKAAFLAVALVTAIVLVLLVWIGRYVLLLLFAGCIGALILSTLTNAIQTKLRLRRSLAFALVVFSLMSLVGLGIWLRGPALVHQIVDLQNHIPSSIDRIHDRLQSEDWGRWLLAQAVGSEQLSRGIALIVSGIGGAMYVTSATLGGLVLVFISSVYLAAEPTIYLRGVERLFRLPTRSVVTECLEEAGRTLKAWLLAKAVSMAAIGTFVAIGLFALQVPLAGTLGIIAGVLTFIPNIGPVLSLLPAALLAFGVSPAKGLLTILLFCFAHFLEGNLVTPLAERKIVRMPPALSLLVQLLLGCVAGVLGVALAAPFTAVLLALGTVLLESNEDETNAAFVKEPRP